MSPLRRAGGACALNMIGVGKKVAVSLARAGKVLSNPWDAAGAGRQRGPL